MIPKIIHFIWINFKNELDENPIIPEKYVINIENCKKINYDFEIKIWNGKECYLLVQKYFPEKVDLYNSFKYPIQRCDMARLMILYIYGGIYSDIDRYSIKSYNILLSKYKEYNVILTKYKYNMYITNDIMICNKNNKFIYNCVNNIIKYNTQFSYLDIFLSTGPFFITYQYYIYSIKDIIIIQDELSPCGYCDCLESINKSISFTVHDGNWINKSIFFEYIKYSFCNIYLIFNIFFLILLIYLFYNKIINNTKNNSLLSRRFKYPKV